MLAEVVSDILIILLLLNSGHLELKGKFLATSFCTRAHMQDDGA
jgi:hypothetical protein